jgi:predicted ATPase
MITKIYIENFKGIGSPGIEIEIKPITLLFGANSAGKSTIIQALHYAKEILKNKNCDPKKIDIGGKVVDFGGFKNVVNNQNLENKIKLKIDFKVNKSFLPAFDDFFEQDLAYDNPEDFSSNFKGSLETAFIELEIYWDYDESIPKVSYSVGFNDEIFGSIKENNNGNGNRYYLENLNLEHKSFLNYENLVYDDDLNEYPTNFLDYLFEKSMIFYDGVSKDSLKNNKIAFLLQDSTIPSWGKSLTIRYTNLLSQYKNEFVYNNVNLEILKKQEKIFELILNVIFVGLGGCLSKELDKLNYIGPIREVPSRTLFFNKDNASWSNGLLAWHKMEESSKEYLNKINEWFHRLGTSYQIFKNEYKLFNTDTEVFRRIAQGIPVEKEEIERYIKESRIQVDIYIKDIDRDIQLKPNDLGVGISQILPVVVASLDPECTFLAIEQPELHIHPKMQVELGDLFIEQINNDSNKLFIIETHSEHLMLRLLRRIEETTLNELERVETQFSPDKLSVYFFESDVNGTKATCLPVDETGEFTKQWPKGFFEERAEELFR